MKLREIEDVKDFKYEGIKEGDLHHFTAVIDGIRVHWCQVIQYEGQIPNAVGAIESFCSYDAKTDPALKVKP